MREVENKEATESARKMVNWLDKLQALDLGNLVFDGFTIIVLVTNNWKDHDLKTAINWGLLGVALVLLWKGGEIKKKEMAVKEMNYQELTEEINERLADEDLRKKINKLLD